MTLTRIYKNCKIIFQPEGRKIKINIEVREGKLFVNNKSFLPDFIFKKKRKIFILDEFNVEKHYKDLTVTSFLNNLIKDGVIAIKNSRLILSE